MWFEELLTFSEIFFLVDSMNMRLKADRGFVQRQGWDQWSGQGWKKTKKLHYHENFIIRKWECWQMKFIFRQLNRRGELQLTTYLATPVLCFVIYLYYIWFSDLFLPDGVGDYKQDRLLQYQMWLSDRSCPKRLVHCLLLHPQGKLERREALR